MLSTQSTGRDTAPFSTQRRCTPLISQETWAELAETGARPRPAAAACSTLMHMQVYLIEVNSCPALALQGKVLENLLPRVVEEVVQKADDPLFPGSAPASRQTLQGFKPLQTQTLRARPLMRVHSTPVAHDSTLPFSASRCDAVYILILERFSTCAGSPSPCRKLVKTNSAPAKPETTSLPQRMHSSVQTIASKG